MNRDRERIKTRINKKKKYQETELELNISTIRREIGTSHTNITRDSTLTALSLWKNSATLRIGIVG